MILELIKYLQDIAKKHKLINYVGYKKSININHQNNVRYFQFIIDSEALLEKQVVDGILTLRLNVDVLGFVDDGTSEVEIQDMALHILLDWMEYINNDNEYPNLEVYDYSIASYSEYTDDNASGVRCTMQLIIPSPVNICEYKDNFIDKEEEIIDEIEMIPNTDCSNVILNKEESNLILNPIKLK